MRTHRSCSRGEKARSNCNSIELSLGCSPMRPTQCCSRAQGMNSISAQVNRRRERSVETFSKGASKITVRTITTNPLHRQRPRVEVTSSDVLSRTCMQQLLAWRSSVALFIDSEKTSDEHEHYMQRLIEILEGLLSSQTQSASRSALQAMSWHCASCVRKSSARRATDVDAENYCS